MLICEFISGVCFFLQCTLILSSVPGYISPEDRKRFLTVAVTALTKLKLENQDLSTVYYGANTFKLLNEETPKVLYLDSCAYIQQNFDKATNAETIFHVLSTWAIQKCATLEELGTSKLHSAATVNVSQINIFFF